MRNYERDIHEHLKIRTLPNGPYSKKPLLRGNPAAVSRTPHWRLEPVGDDVEDIVDLCVGPVERLWRYGAISPGNRGSRLPWHAARRIHGVPAHRCLLAVTGAAKRARGARRTKITRVTAAQRRATSRRRTRCSARTQLKSPTKIRPVQFGKQLVSVSHLGSPISRVRSYSMVSGSCAPANPMQRGHKNQMAQSD